MSTTTFSQLPSVTELVQLLQTAFPMHWENHVRNLGLAPGRDLPPAELARVTERVFWMVPQMGIKDPAAWLANRARLKAVTAPAAPVKPETSPNIAGDFTAERDYVKLVEAKLRVDAAKIFDGSLPTSTNGTTKVEPPSPSTRGDVQPQRAQLAPPIGAESNRAAAASEAGEISLGDDRKDSKDSDDRATLISALPEACAAPIKAASPPTALTEELPTGSMEAELLSRAYSVSGATQADAPKAETHPQKVIDRKGRSGGRARKKQRISEAGSKGKRKLLMRKVLEYLRQHPNISAAARKSGIHPKTLAYWIKCSTAGHPAYELNWRRFKLLFHEHCEEARAETFGALFEIALEWTQERVIYKIDPLAVSLGFEGPAAYLRDEKGLPVVEVIYHARPKMIRFVLQHGYPEKWGKDAASQKPGVAASIKTRQWQMIKKILDNDD
jgi:hypothetical protein